MAESPEPSSPTCPLPIADYPTVQLAHGGGGSLMHQLLSKVFQPSFDNDLLNQMHDGATFTIDGPRLAFTTDSYVVKPLFFPGGDIGKLAVCGTVNDLAMCAATPRYLSVGFIIEEGLPMEDLWRVVQSMRAVAESSGVKIVTGDTKVVDKGKGDGVFINTAGIGVIDHHQQIGPAHIREGDAILLSGDLGRHGTAIMASREGLEFETTLKSDCAPLGHVVQALLEGGVEIHCLRDLTRGGLASALVELARDGAVQVNIDSTAVPVREDVRAACEILGLDPLYVANEGRFIVILPQDHAARGLQILKEHADDTDASEIGRIAMDKPGRVTMKNEIGTTRLLDLLSGEQLPRIC